MTPCEKLGYKAGDKFTAMRDSFGGGYRKGDVLVLREDDRSACPFFLNVTKGGTACCELEYVTKIHEKLTLMPGDYVEVKDLSEANYHAVAAAFLSAGSYLDEYRKENPPYAGYEFFGWETNSNGLAHWNDPDTFGKHTRLLTVPQVLGTITQPATEWNGTGLPPVGSTVELHNDPGYMLEYGHEIIGKNVKVAGFVKSGPVDIAVIEFDASMYCFRTDMLRPVRTEQQRLTEELQQSANLKPKQAERVIAAGYRKEVAK